jgi:hypothetical protein
MNVAAAVQVAVATTRIVKTITTHRKQMKKLREEKQFWIDLKENVEARNQKPAVIYVQCERLA